jgi:hypothetical protein
VETVKLGSADGPRERSDAREAYEVSVECAQCGRCPNSLEADVIYDFANWDPVFGPYPSPIGGRLLRRKSGIFEMRPWLAKVAGVKVRQIEILGTHKQPWERSYYSVDRVLAAVSADRRTDFDGEPVDPAIIDIRAKWLHNQEQFAAAAVEAENIRM